MGKTLHRENLSPETTDAFFMLLMLIALISVFVPVFELSYRIGAFVVFIILLFSLPFKSARYHEEGIALCTGMDHSTHATPDKHVTGGNDLSAGIYIAHHNDMAGKFYPRP